MSSILTYSATARVSMSLSTTLIVETLASSCARIPRNHSSSGQPTAPAPTTTSRSTIAILFAVQRVASWTETHRRSTIQDRPSTCCSISCPAPSASRARISASSRRREPAMMSSAAGPTVTIRSYRDPGTFLTRRAKTGSAGVAVTSLVSGAAPSASLLLAVAPGVLLGIPWGARRRVPPSQRNRFTRPVTPARDPDGAGTLARRRA
jgi:hypothetical protein